MPCSVEYPDGWSWYQSRRKVRLTSQRVKRGSAVEVIILIKLIIIQLLLKLKFVNKGIQKINLDRIEKITPIDNT